ncbi:MAG: DHH family phosphoesterase [bacterium]
MWPVRPIDEPAAAALAAAAGTSPLLGRLLWLRGVRDAAAARRWLEPRLEDLYPPESLPDFAPAADRVIRAIERRETILIWGHDDLDGVTAVALLKLVLEGMRARVLYHIPARGREKHGLDAGRAEAFAAQGARLVITVDCGITNRADIARLGERGVDVIVTDHHELPDGLPPALASIDPKRPDSAYGYRGLSGAGVALKFALGLAGRRPGLTPAEFWSSEPDAVALAVLGTIADRVPLTGENRTLVACGMGKLLDCRLAAVRAVLARLDCGPAHGRYAPLAALPRLLPLFAAADGLGAVERLLDPDPASAGWWLDELEQKAKEWQAEAEATWQLAQAAARIGDGLIVVKDRRLSLRALGYCATRFRYAYHLPALVMGWRGDAWVGECRGTEGMSLVELLSAQREKFIDYGGHRLAAGFTIADERVEEFIAAAERYAHENFARSVAQGERERADLLLPLAGFEPGVRRLAPFGEGNPRPWFVSEPTRVREHARYWTAETRPDLPLYPGPAAVLPDDATARLLYTVDDEGRVLVRECRAAPGEPADGRAG